MSEIVKIAFSGTSCAGKSTLLEHCREKMADGVIIVEEAAREYFMANPGIIDRVSEPVQNDLQNLGLQKEQTAHYEAEARGKPISIICDRSVLDVPAYSHSQGHTGMTNRLLERVQFWIPTYSKIFLLDPDDIPYVSDDIRTEDESYRQNLHVAFLEFFEENNLPYELLSGTTIERYARVSSFITEQTTRLR